MLGVGHVVTGHNVDDVAETVLMNLLRGDLPRLSRATSIVTSTPSAAISKSAKVGEEVSFTNVKRSKPLMYAYEKEIVLYAHHKKLDYFSTECIYSPEAFRGSARTLIKNLERIRPESIMDVVRSGVDMARLVPGSSGKCGGGCNEIATTGTFGDGESGGGCSNSNNSNYEDGQDSMSAMETQLKQEERAHARGSEIDMSQTALHSISGKASHTHEAHSTLLPRTHDQKNAKTSKSSTQLQQLSLRTKAASRKIAHSTSAPKQRLGSCERCGYLSSQAVCKACVLLEGLNKARPKTSVEIGSNG